MIKVSDFQRDWENLREKHLFLACSGGVDSMVLLHLLRHVADKLTVLHVNYRLRGADSDADAALVSETCKTYGIPVQVKVIEMKKVLAKGGNLQDMAREFRYDWFREILSQDESHCVVLGHHSDDQVETFFQHLARKSGVTGMAGMLENHKGFVRPLLKYPKREIRAFAETHRIAWREDMSNAGNAYTRNKLRNLILPELEKEIPGLQESVLLLVGAFQETHRELGEKVKNLVEVIADTGNWLLEDFDSRSGEEKAEVLRRIGVRQPFIAEIEKLRSAQKGKKLLIGGFQITREKDAFHLEMPGRGNTSPAVTGSLDIRQVNRLPAAFGKDVLYLDAEKVHGTLQLRPWQTGDRMKPLGVKGSKLVSAILKDAGIPARRKREVQVLTDESRILWCVGVCVSSEALARTETLQVLQVQVIFEQQ